ncbi:DnaJ-domain-containing protein [Massarina eburnea CBS 473.64]|uniref:DnaJ-domain-containing protein n=1 Tax=Massarina eburnea CBS 473.64 TaxID=1395130 RepID=A0A6A6S279_9PLEO|nr:DnaJ-domain-containing protein [Massarina eburnea CBS 473.64]
MANVNCTLPFRKTSFVSTLLNNENVDPSIEPSSDLPKLPAFSKIPKLRSRKKIPSINIFIDPDTATPPSPTTATTRPPSSGRTPLGTLKDGGNARYVSQPSSLDLPWPYSPHDPNWEDTENYLLSPLRSATFPSMNMPTSLLAPSSSTSTPHWWSHPSTPASSVPSSPLGTPPTTPGPEAPRVRARQPRTTRTRVISAAVDRPKNMELYRLLGIKDAKASSLDIKAAYKKVAFKYHPDKVVDNMREVAHKRMAKINAAKDVLMDAVARKKYDKDGKLPWVV